jgi:K+ transporter
MSHIQKNLLPYLNVVFTAMGNIYICRIYSTFHIASGCVVMCMQQERKMTYNYMFTLYCIVFIYLHSMNLYKKMWKQS